MPDQEGVEFVIDPRSVSQALAQMNNSIVSFEKGATGANERLNSSFQRVSDLLLKSNDRSFNSQERLVKSIEKQAAAYGRTGVEKLVAQRDAYIKRLGDEENQIKRVTAAYEKMIKAEESRGEGGGATQKGFLAAKDLFEGRNAYASVEAGKALVALQGIPAVAAAAATSIGLVTLAGYEFAKSLSEWGDRMNDVQLRTGLTAEQLGKFDYATKASGTDLTAIESTMRGITVAAEDVSTKGEAGRKWLERWGVDIAQVRAGNADYADTLQKVGEGLAALPPGIERSKAALDVMKKAGIENIPWLVELNEHLKTASEQGLGFKQSDIDGAQKMKEQLALFDRQWDDTMRKLKAPLALGVVGALDLALMGLDKIGKFLDDHPVVMRFLLGTPEAKPPTGVDREMQMTRGFGFGAAESIEGHRREQRGIARENSEVDETLKRWGRTKEGMQAALAEAKRNETEALDDLRKHDRTQMGGGHEQILKLNQASADVSSIEAQIKAAAKLESERAAITETLRKLQQEQSDKARDAFQQLPADRELSRISAMPSIKPAEVEQARKLLEPQRMKELRDEADKLKLLLSEIDSLANKATDKRFEDVSKQLSLSYEAGLKTQQEAFKLQDSITREGAGGQLRQEESDIKRGGLLDDRTAADQLRTDAHLLAARKSFLDEQYAYEQRLMQDNYADDENLELRQQELRLKHASDVADLQMQLAERVAEEQRRQFDTIQRDAQGLFETLFTRPAEFGKQLAQTVRAAFLKPITEGLSNTVASALQPLIYGRSGDGGLSGSMKGIFGEKTTDPIKASTDLLKGSTDVNSGATDRNTDELRRLTQALERRESSGGGGGGGSGASHGFFSGFPSFARTAALGMASFAGLGGVGLPAFAGSPPLAPQVTSTLGGSDMEGLSGRGGFEGIAGGVPYESSPMSSPFAGNPAGDLGIGGTAGFSGGFGGPSSGGRLLSRLFGGGTSQGQGGVFGGFRNIASNFKDINWGGFTRAGQGIPGADGEAGVDTGGKGSIKGVNGLAGAGLQAGGMYLAQRGLLGKDRGTTKGIFEGAAGGAAIGLQMGGPIGAAVGAAIGAGIGLGEKLAGVESPENKAVRIIKETYRIDINKQMAQQIVQIADSKYGRNVNLAARSPEVRQMLELYAAGTGQGGKMPLSATAPIGASLSERGGQLYQDQTYRFGVGRVQQSNLPIAGGGSPATYPSPQTVQLIVADRSSMGDLLDGRVASTVSPGFVQDRFAAAQASSNGRLANSAMVQAPGLVFG